MRLARENPWGAISASWASCTGIGSVVSAMTVKVLREVQLAPQESSAASRREFDTIWLQRLHVLVFIEIGSRCVLASIPSGQKPLTSASPLGTLQAMRGGFTAGAGGQGAQATRIDLLLQTLACATNSASSRVRLGVFAQLTVCCGCCCDGCGPGGGRRCALQPATVYHWYRDGVWEYWRRRGGVPGRPCIDSSCRDLIRRMAAENSLVGPSRIHGELLRLGIAISARAVSRYLRGRPPTRSQTRRTFFANHLGGPALTSPVMFADARGDAVVVDSSDVSFHPVNCRRIGPGTGGVMFDRLKGIKD